MNLFVYGELCQAEVIVGLLGRMPICVPALLHDHQRELNAATGYYQARPSTGRQVVGLLFREVAADELQRLDEFEDVANGLYRRVECRVESLGEAPRQVTAHAYLHADSTS